MQPDSYQRFNDPTRLILFFFVVLGLSGSWQAQQRYPGVDYYVAWTVADATRKQLGYRVYEFEDQRRLAGEYESTALMEGKTSPRAAFAKIPLFRVTGSPFLYSLVNLVSTNNYKVSLQIWNALSLLAFTVAIVLFCNLLGLSRTANLTLLGLLLFWMSAFQSDVRVGNVNCLQLCWLALVLCFLSRDHKTVYLFLAGFLLATLAMLKLNSAPVALLVLAA